MSDLNIIQNNSNSPIELQELVSFLDENVDFNDADSIKESSVVFGRLYWNRILIKKHILESLENGLDQFELANRYTPPSIILHNSEKYIIRANLWRAVKKYGESDINLYGLAHDHNFDFLTLNFHGPGYKSRMYTYDYHKVSGRVNEKVALTDNGVLSLREGEMYLYRKSLDVHTQIPPTADSITINLMAKLSPNDDRMQYIFDLNSRVISDVYGGFYAKRHVFDMASLLGDQECDSLLKDIQKNTDCSLSREYLAQLSTE